MSPWTTLIDPDKKGETNADATIEQLYDCVSLLALSIVHHRSKFGVVPFEYSATALSIAEIGSGPNGDITEGRQTLEQALKIIKSLSNQRPERKAPRIKLEEQRQQIRINVSAPVNVITDNSTTPLKAKLEDISWGGASLRSDQPVGKTGDLINVELPSFRGHHISVRARILRILNTRGELTYGVRFTGLRTADEEIFEQLLEFLADSEDDPGQRKDARLTQRIEIQYDDASELQATLEDISTGGIGITVSEPMELDQSLLAVISTTDEKCQLILRARVVRRDRMDFSNITLYRVGLEFEHPTDDLKDQIKKLIQKMASTNPKDKFHL